VAILAAEPVLQDDGVLSVYPNPATQRVTVSLTATGPSSQIPTLRLTDLRGATIRTATLQWDGKNYTTKLDVSDLPGGTFFVVVSDDRTTGVRVKRIHKQ
jgi:hypothetical protein